MTMAEGNALVNVARVEIVTEETVPRTLTFTTADEAKYTPKVSDGKEVVLRTKNTLHAIDKTEDIQYGSDIVLTDNKFSAEVLAIVDGGTVVMDTATPTKIVGYTPPIASLAVNRIIFTTNVYTEEKDTDGTILSYFKFAFPSCKGTPTKFSFKDGTFMTPEYTIESRAKKGEGAYDLSILTPVAFNALTA